MKTIIHVNQHNVKRNKKGAGLPVVTVKNYKENRYCNNVIIKDKDGAEVARVIYSPSTPLPCGAHVWIETQNEIEIIE